jgi:hypothetical protein
MFYMRWPSIAISGVSVDAYPTQFSPPLYLANEDGFESLNCTTVLTAEQKAQSALQLDERIITFRKKVAPTSPALTFLYHIFILLDCMSSAAGSGDYHRRID